MAIIMYPSERGGYGDYSFMITLARHLESAQEILPEIVMVVDDPAIKAALQARFDLGKLQLLTQDEFEQAVKIPGKNQLIPTLLIEGPTYKAGRGITVDSSVPVLYTAEYSANEGMTLSDTFLLVGSRHNKGNPVISLDAGLREATGLSMVQPPVGRFKQQAERGVLSGRIGFSNELVKAHYGQGREKGIVLRSDLLKQGDLREADQKSFQQNCYNKLDSSIQRTLNPMQLTAEQYLSANSPYFIYTHDPNSLANFIRVVTQSQAQNTAKNCDIIVVGKSEELNLKSLYQEIKQLPFLVDFDRCVIEYDNKTEVMDMHPENTPGKVLRIVHFPHVRNQDVINLLSISNRIAGVTGDQSFSECIALGNIPIYSCLLHKEPFFDALIELTKQLNLPSLEAFLLTSVYYVKKENKSQLTHHSGQRYDLNQVHQDLLKLKAHLVEHYNYLQHLLDITRRIFQEPAPGFRKNIIDAITSEIQKIAAQGKNTDLLEYLGILNSSLYNGLSITAAYEFANSQFPDLIIKSKGRFNQPLPIFKELENAMLIESQTAQQSRVNSEGEVVSLVQHKIK